MDSSFKIESTIVAVVFWSFFLLVATPTKAAIPQDPLEAAAEYYADKHQFDTSLKAWEELHRRYPLNSKIILRLADHQLLLIGRPQARATLLAGIRNELLTLGDKRHLEDRLNQINASFVTDDGQSLYYQGLASLKRQEISRSENLFELSNRSENLNTLVLGQLAQCQLKQNAIGRYVNTVKNIHYLNPTNWNTRLQLIEAHLFESHPGLALELFGDSQKIPRTAAFQTAYAASLYETGAWEQSRRIFHELTGRTELNRPIVWYYLGKIFENSNKTMAHHYFQQFRKLASRRRTSKEDFDPYRTLERLEKITPD